MENLFVRVVGWCRPCVTIFSTLLSKSLTSSSQKLFRELFDLLPTSFDRLQCDMPGQPTVLNFDPFHLFAILCLPHKEDKINASEASDLIRLQFFLQTSTCLPVSPHINLFLYNLCSTVEIYGWHFNNSSFGLPSAARNCHILRSLTK